MNKLPLRKEKILPGARRAQRFLTPICDVNVHAPSVAAKEKGNFTIDDMYCVRVLSYDKVRS